MTEVQPSEILNGLHIEAVEPTLVLAWASAIKQWWRQVPPDADWALLALEEERKVRRGESLPARVEIVVQRPEGQEGAPC